MCHRDVLGVKPSETSILVTEPLFSPNELKDNLEEFCFETMGFARVCTATPPLLAFNDHKHWDPNSVLSRTGCGVVIDSGFSNTHVAPLFEGRILHKACRRIDVGGKVMTNLLKEQLSYRYALVAKGEGSVYFPSSLSLRLDNPHAACVA